MKQIILIVMAMAIQYTTFGQSNEHNIGVAIGNGNELTSIRGEYTYYIGLGAKKKFKIGVGARMAYGFGSDLRFAEVNTENNGDGGADQNAITITDVGLGGLNAVLGIKYSFNEKWDLGLRFDVVGLAFGANQGGLYQPINGTSISNVETTTPNPNIAFTRGQVMSDNIWLGYTINNHHQLFASFAFYGTEYELTDNSTINLTDPRFERIHQMVFIGYNYRF